MKNKPVTDSKLFLNETFAVFIGKINDVDIHKHHYIQLTICLEDSLKILFENSIHSFNSILINSDFEHKVDCENKNQLILFISPESNAGKEIRETILLGKNYHFYNFDEIQPIKHYLKTNDIITNSDIILLIDKIFDYFNLKLKNPVNYDFRIKNILAKIDTINEKKISLKKLAEFVNLSESRLLHLFSSEVGITIRRYLLWKRMIEGIRSITDKKDFTYSAHETGFFDSSHMSKTFKFMFGINLSDIFNDSNFIQVIS